MPPCLPCDLAIPCAQLGAPAASEPIRCSVEGLKNNLLFIFCNPEQRGKALFPPFLLEKYQRGHPMVTAGLLNFMALQVSSGRGLAGWECWATRKNAIHAWCIASFWDIPFLLLSPLLAWLACFCLLPRVRNAWVTGGLEKLLWFHEEFGGWGWTERGGNSCGKLRESEELLGPLGLP